MSPSQIAYELALRSMSEVDEEWDNMNTRIIGMFKFSLYLSVALSTFSKILELSNIESVALVGVICSILCAIVTGIAWTRWTKEVVNLQKVVASTKDRDLEDIYAMGVQAIDAICTRNRLRIKKKSYFAIAILILILIQVVGMVVLGVLEFQGVASECP